MRHALIFKENERFFVNARSEFIADLQVFGREPDANVILLKVGVDDSRT
jgi:hypothetical protein